jgi:uncharacterized protein
MLLPAFVLVNHNFEFGFYSEKRNDFVAVSPQLYEYLSSIESIIASQDETKLMPHLDCLDNELCELLFYTEQCDALQDDEDDILFNVEPDSIIDDLKDAMLTIELTNECNLSCLYCTGDHRTTNRIDFMTDEVADKLVKFIETNYLDRSIVIAFYGGEPLLNFDRLKSIVDQFSKSDFVVKSYGITTNLTIINDDIIDFFNDTNMKVLVSFDGYKENHDYNRRTKNDEGTYDVIYKNIVILYEGLKNKDNFAINCVITPNTNVALLTKYFNNFPYVKKKGEFYENLSFNYVSNISSKLDYINNYSLESISGYQKNYLDMLERVSSGKIIEHVNSEIDDFIYNMWYLRICHMYKIVNLKFNEGLKKKVCEPGERKVYVSSTGVLKVCNMLNSKNSHTDIGTLDNGFSTEVCEYMENIQKSFRKGCINCYCQRFCRPCLANMFDDRDSKFDKEFMEETFCFGEKMLSRYVLNFLFYISRSDDINMKQLFGKIGGSQ